MCGRFTITLEPAFFQQEFILGKMPSEWTPRYNAAPTQNIPVVKDEQSRDVEMMRWGLIPFWAKDPSIGSRLINARAETLGEKPSFRGAFEKRRCLILTDGFYEWQKSSVKGSPKAPYRFILKEEKPFMFAGLWESWRPRENEVVHSCTIITCAANQLVSAVHNRMPVMLDKDTCWRWLEDLPQEALNDLLKPYPSEKMTAYPVSVRLNNPKEEDAALVEPLSP